MTALLNLSEQEDRSQHSAGSANRFPASQATEPNRTTRHDNVSPRGRRIGEPARKHGIGDDDIWHAVRTAIRKIEMDDELTMLTGPARDCTPLDRRARLGRRRSGRHPRHAAAREVLSVHRARVI
jgi:hypothetical protein